MTTQEWHELEQYGLPCPMHISMARAYWQPIIGRDFTPEEWEQVKIRLLGYKSSVHEAFLIPPE